MNLYHSAVDYTALCLPRARFSGQENMRATPFTDGCVTFGSVEAAGENGLISSFIMDFVRLLSLSESRRKEALNLYFGITLTKTLMCLIAETFLQLSLFKAYYFFKIQCLP